MVWSPSAGDTGGGASQICEVLAHPAAGSQTVIEGGLPADVAQIAQQPVSNENGGAPDDFYWPTTPENASGCLSHVETSWPMTRARERREEQEFFERERESWRRHAWLLEEECAELDRAISAAFVNSASVGSEAIKRRLDTAAEIAANTAEMKARAAQTHLELQSLEKEEALLEAVARERMQSSALHANNAQMLQERATHFEALAAQEAEVSETLATELSALQSRALLEERRSIQEQRVRDLHLQVAEAATRDAETAAADFAATASAEQEEDAAQHTSTVRRWRANCAKRLVALEAEAASVKVSKNNAKSSTVEKTTSSSSRQTGNLGRAGRLSPRQHDSVGSTVGKTTSSSSHSNSMRKQSDAASIAARHAGLLTELKERRASDARRSAAARDEVAQSLQQIRDEAAERLQYHVAEEAELNVIQMEARAACENASAANAAVAAAACRCSRLEQRVRECVLEDNTALADAEVRAAEDCRWRQRLRGQNGALETCAAELQAGLSRAEQAIDGRLASLRAELLNATEAARTAQANEAHLRAALAAPCGLSEQTLHQERMSAEAACEAAAATAHARHIEQLRAEKLRRDRAHNALAELRGALRRQHAAAEAAHASAISEEEEAKRLMQQIQFAGLDTL